MRRWVVRGCILFLLVSVRAEAVVTETCIVQFHSNRGWSREFRREVTFFTGRELSTAPSTLKFKLHDVYALIAFDRGTLVVVEFDETLLGVGAEFAREDFQRTIESLPFRSATQIDAIGKGLKWRIKVPPRTTR